jgi:hypothetical protein
MRASYVSLARGLTPRAVAFSRMVADFAYVRPGPVRTSHHHPVWDERHRSEEWRSGSLPVLSPHPLLTAAGDAALLANEHTEVRALRGAHEHTWLVHFVVARLRESAGGGALPLPEGELRALLAAPAGEEAARLATPAGVEEALGAARVARAEARAALGALEADALDGGLGGATAAPAGGGGGGGAVLPLSDEARNAATLELAAKSGALRAALRALRAVNVAHAARIRLLGGGEDSAAAERAWLEEELGLHGGLAPPVPRSSVLPPEAYTVHGAPLDAPLSTTELRDSELAADADLMRAMGMEHRDRAEFLSRAKLPPPLHAGAPSPVLEAAARALDGNPSLSRPQKEAMLAMYADAVEGRAELAYDFSAERAAIEAPQPQHKYYDPAVTAFADDADDALAARGQFSFYRGSQWLETNLDPGRYGGPRALAARTAGPSLGNGVGGAARAPLETAEEVEVNAAAIERGFAAEAAAASARITAALQRSMGIRPPRAAAAAAPPPGAPATFFQRLAAGERPASIVPPPPRTDNRQDVDREELVKAAGNSAKQKTKGKGKK